MPRKPGSSVPAFAGAEQSDDVGIGDDRYRLVDAFVLGPFEELLERLVAVRSARGGSAGELVSDERLDVLAPGDLDVRRQVLAARKRPNRVTASA